MSKIKIGLCECGSNRRYIAKVKSVLGETLYFVRCPYCGRESGSSLDRIEAIELWNNSYGRSIKAVNENGNVRMCECEHCPYCHRYKTRYAIRTEYQCNHADQKSIEKYFNDHKQLGMPGFIGFSKPNGDFPRKNTPKWCPRAKEKAVELDG